MHHRVASLTGLRALAAALVCLTHAAYYTGHYTDDLAGHLWSRLEIGVPMFFALSGFLLFRPWVDILRRDPGPEHGRQPDLLRYAWHRFRRVVPAYWAVVTVVYLLGLFRHEPNPSGHGLNGYLRNLSLTQIYGFGHQRVGLTQAWSLCIEVAFYLALPLIGWVLTALVCRYRWRPRRLIAGLVVVAAITPVWIAVAPGLEITARMWPPAYLWWFVGGMTLAVADRLVPRLSGRATAGCLALALLAYLVAALPAVGGAPMIVPRGVNEALVKSALYLVVATALLAPLVLGRAGSTLYHRLLRSRPMVWLGEISYEFFLIHLIVMDVVVLNLFGWHLFTGNLWLVFLVTCAVTVPLAWALRAALPFGDNEDERADSGADRTPTETPDEGEHRDAAGTGSAHRRTGTTVV